MIKLHEQIAGFRGKWGDLKPSRAPSGSADALMLQLEELRTQLADLALQGEQACQDAALFDLPAPDLSGLADLLADVDATVDAWGQYRCALCSALQRHHSVCQDLLQASAS